MLKNIDYSEFNSNSRSTPITTLLYKSTAYGSSLADIRLVLKPIVHHLNSKVYQEFQQSLFHRHVQDPASQFHTHLYSVNEKKINYNEYSI